MDQAQLDLQLKVWKDLAISKQILMRTAASALKLDPDCSQEELKEALEKTIKRGEQADAEVLAAREQAKQAIAEMEKKLAAAERDKAQAEKTAADLQTRNDNLTQQIAAERATNAKELQKLKERLAEREKALKAINTALADTPENVLKKMNALKKQRQDEAEARRQIEASFATLRTEKRKQDQQLADAQKNGTRLAAAHRELHDLCTTLHERLKPLVEDPKDLPALPPLDTKLLEEMEQAGVKDSGKT